MPDVYEKTAAQASWPVTAQQHPFLLAKPSRLAVQKEAVQQIVHRSTSLKASTYQSVGQLIPALTSCDLPASDQKCCNAEGMGAPLRGDSAGHEGREQGVLGGHIAPLLCTQSNAAQQPCMPGSHPTCSISSGAEHGAAAHGRFMPPT